MSRPFRARLFLAPFPRALPWAGMSRPFRACINFVASLVDNFAALVESERASDSSGSPFASNALWSPRSPRCIDAAHDWRTLPSASRTQEMNRQDAKRNNPPLNPTLKRHTSTTRLIFFRFRQSLRLSVETKCVSHPFPPPRRGGGPTEHTRDKCRNETEPNAGTELGQTREQIWDKRRNSLVFEGSFRYDSSHESIQGASGRFTSSTQT
jgi:hypothetical protein